MRTTPCQPPKLWSFLSTNWQAGSDREDGPHCQTKYVTRSGHGVEGESGDMPYEQDPFSPSPSAKAHVHHV